MPTSGAIRRCEELRRSSSDDQTLDGVVTRNLAALYAMAGRLDDAREAIRRSSAVLDDLAEAKELLGDRAGAKEELSAAWRRFGDIGGNTPDRRAMHGAYKLALLYCDDGRWDDAERCLEYGSEVSQLPQFSGEIPLGLAARARVAARRDDAMRAAALAQAAVELVDRSDNLNLRGRVWSAFAEVERKSGSEAQADAATAEAIRLYEQKGNITAAERLRSSA
jgi:tetratricopeptide (TPR) repeat protein